jgi:isopentenyl diphosphate isomerase/L-lactate dehydrogenase-like FMN-dependent dehydrogenase
MRTKTGTLAECMVMDMKDLRDAGKTGMLQAARQNRSGAPGLPERRAQWRLATVDATLS